MNLRLDNFVAVGLLVAACFAALAHGAVEAWSVAILELMIALLVLLWGIKIILENRLSLIIPSSFWPLLGLALMGLVQSLRVNRSGVSVIGLSQDFEASRIFISIFFSLLVFFLLQTNFIANRERLRGLASFLSIYGFIFALFALIQHFTWNGKFYWVRKPLSDLSTPYGSFANHNHFAGYMELLIGIPLALVMAGGVRKEERVFYGFVASIIGITVIFSLSRGGIFSLLCEVIFIALASGRLQRKRGSEKEKIPFFRRFASIIIILLAIGGSIWWLGADPIIGRFNSENQDNLTASRLWIWKDSFKVFLTYPVFGAGLGSFQTVYPRQSQYDGSRGYVAQAHNDYLQILAEGGMIGGFLALWFIGVVGRDVFRGLRSPDPLIAGLALGSGAGFCALLIHSLIDFNLQLPSNAMMFLMLCAISSFCSRSVSEQEIVVEYPSQHPHQKAPRLSVGVSK